MKRRIITATVTMVTHSKKAEIFFDTLMECLSLHSAGARAKEVKREREKTRENNVKEQ